MNNLLPAIPARMGRLAGLTVLPLIACLVLVGCSTGQAGPTEQADSAGDGSSDSSHSTGAAAAPVAQNDSLRAAVNTARTAVSAGTVLSASREQNGSAYEVILVTDDGSEHEVHTDSTGTTLSGAPRTEASDAEDRAEHTRLLAAADINALDAIDTLLRAQPGIVTELSLDENLGTVVWDGDIRDTSGTNHTVQISATTGQVTTSTIDTESADTDD